MLKPQPKLLFASAHYLVGAPPGTRSLHDLVTSRPADLSLVILTRKRKSLGRSEKGRGRQRCG